MSERMPEKEAGLVGRVWRWVVQEWDTPTGVLGGIAASFSQVANTAWAWALIVAGALMMLAAMVGSVINQKRSASVERAHAAAIRERDTMKDDLAAVSQVSKAVYRSLLGSVARELELTAQERISVYLHDAGLPTFQLLSRHSPNPLLEDAAGRSVYPDHYGLIGQAWRNGWAEESELPDPNVSGTAYVGDNLKKYNLPQEVTEGLTMKSRVLVGLRYPHDAIGAKPIGVLIVESTNADWDMTGMRAKLEASEMWYTLQEHLRAQRHALPKLSVAEGLGY